MYLRYVNDWENNVGMSASYRHILPKSKKRVKCTAIYVTRNPTIFLRKKKVQSGETLGFCAVL